MFKARVFPIFAHSEKRIKITYTQVLPLRGNRYRYSYGLRSEMLKQKPLRELSIDVKLHSALPIRSVDCPNHAARIDHTQHSAHIEFNAQEYTPQRDFEVTLDIDGRQSDVVVIPHQRGDDGYFMLQLTPPSPDGNWQRDLLPDGAPIKLLVLADTSASMDQAQRATQSQFIAALLGSLGAKDQFNLAVCDVDCLWSFEELSTVTDEHVQQARDFLDDRVSLGWTDLGRAFTSVLERADKRTHVVYVGDAIVTSGSADSTEFVNRLRRLVEGQDSTFHAVTVGNSFEPTVLKAIAAVGGGSLRQIRGDAGPQTTAKELLNEIAQPGLTDLNVQINGVRVARVYPERLPNIPAGSQQIIIGRYLPGSGAQQGQVVVTGKRDGQTVRYQTNFALDEAEQGNAFIPRLWARLHLDQLLEQGRSSQIRDEIIALSEEYHIITPYTSLLVLESDADRERFNVKRRFLMRDGEKFFADGRDNALFELKQKQMKQAGLWRLALRRRVLKFFARMGRDASLLNLGRGSSPFQPREGNGMMGGGGQMGVPGKNLYFFSGDFQRLDNELYLGSQMDVRGSMGGMGGSGSIDGLSQLLSERKLADEMTGGEMGGEMGGEYENQEGGDLAAANFDEKEMEWPSASSISTPFGPWDKSNFSTSSLRSLSLDVRKAQGLGLGANGGYFGEWSQLMSGQHLALTEYVRRRPMYPNGLIIQSQFPRLRPVSIPAESDKSEWPREAVELSNSLLRIESLKQLEGLEIEHSFRAFDAKWQRTTQISQGLWLYSPTRWLNHATQHGQQTLVRWCDTKQRGVYSKALLLGSRRKSKPSDHAQPSVWSGDRSLRPLHHSFAHMTASVEAVGDERVRLILKQKQTHGLPPAQADQQYRLLIDTSRHVVLETESTRQGKPVSKVIFSEFVEVGQRHWATRRETFNAGGERTSVETAVLNVLTADVFDKRFQAELLDRAPVQFLNLPLNSNAQAREARASGRARFEDHVVLADYYASSQQWKRVHEHLRGMETLANDQRGMWHIRNTVLQMSRKHEELRKRLLAAARSLAAKPAVDELFLANRIANAGQTIAAGHESLRIQDALHTIYDRQPEHTLAQKIWMVRRAATLMRLGRTDEALELRRRTAVKFPFDVPAQTQYAEDLATHRRHFDTAIAWLEQTLKRQEQWTSGQQDAIRVALANVLETSGRYPELLEFCREWMQRNPDTQFVYARYLSALVWNDRIDEMETVMRDWMNEATLLISDGRALDDIDAFLAPVDQQIPDRARLKLLAAVQMAMGQGHSFYSYRIDPKWLQPLSKLALAWARQQPNIGIANRIMSHSRFHSSDAAADVRRLAFRLLEAELEELTPSNLDTVTDWALQARFRVETPQWQKLADRLETRWAAEQDVERKQQLGRTLDRVMVQKMDMERRLAFLRRQHREAPRQYAVTYASQLFHALIKHPAWQEAHEAEAFGLLTKLSADGKSNNRLLVIVPALYQLTDSMIQSRYRTALKQVDQQTKANRKQYRLKKSELLTAARAGVAARLKQRMAQEEPWLADWLAVEHVYLSVLLKDDLPAAVRACRAFLGAAPPKPAIADPDAADPDAEDIAAVERAFAGILRQRYLMTAAHLATRRATTQQMAEFLLKYLEAGIAQSDAALTEVDGAAAAARVPPEKDEDTSEQPPFLKARNLSWKAIRFQLLIALDRPDQLERELRTWVLRDRQTAPWRLSLAQLLAERGRIQEAVRLYEAVEHNDQLKPAEYRALADWYLVLDRRDAQERARVDYFKTMSENSIVRRLNRAMQTYQATDGSAPAQLSDEVLLMVRALLEKSSDPSNHLYHLQQFYHTTRDFRVFAALPHAVIGRTAGSVYNLVGNVRNVTGVIQDEATVDEIVSLLRKVRRDAESPIDHRALDLLEVVVELRATQLQNQPGPHARAALAALKRSDQRAWTDGEPVMMSRLLAALGNLAPAALADEQLRQLQALFDGAQPGTLSRLQIAQHLTQARWNYGDRDRSLLVLETAIREFDLASQRRWPVAGNGVLSDYCSKLEQIKRFAQVERIMRDHLARPADQKQSLWFEDRLDHLYYTTLRDSGEVTLGTGETLYRNFLARLMRRLENANDQTLYQVVQRISSVYSLVGGKKRVLLLGNVKDDVRAFAFERSPQVLKRATNSYRSMVQTVGNLVSEVLGKTEGIRYLVERIETDPPRFRYRDDNAWNRNSGTLGNLLRQVKTLPAELEQRLLKIVLAELRHDLLSRHQRGRYLYSQNYGYWWKAKRADFLKVVEEVLAQGDVSGAAAAYIAQYLYNGLDAPGRAIEVLFAAHRAQRLNDAQIAVLVQYLHAHERWGESVALLEPLVERHPANLVYRTQLMAAYFHTGRKRQLLDELAETDKIFHQQNRWNEYAMSMLANACSNAELWEQAVSYYSQAIVEHQRSRADRGIGQGTLSAYFAKQCEAYQQLDRTREAVDAASSAIVSWGRTHQQRTSAIKRLQQVFVAAGDRDDYAAYLDEQARATGQDRPIVRKALGQAYQQLNQLDRAIAQLEIAVQLQPNDSSTHKALLACYDQLEDKQSAIDQVLALLQLTRRDGALYADLAARLKDDETAQERAHTSIVEMQPHESESHTRLAEIRQKQNRWDDAIRHWEHVVRIRSLEPTGLLRLTTAQIHEKRWDAARATLKRLSDKSWPPRFSDVDDQVRQLEKQIPVRK